MGYQHKNNSLASISIDKTLLLVVFSLALWGLVMVYSASIFVADAETNGANPHHYAVRHLVYLLSAFLVGFLSFHVPSRWWQKSAPMLFFVGLILLVVVLFPHVGHSVNGSRRWIHIKSLSLQPSEFMKLLAIFYAADYTVRRAAMMHSFRSGFLPMVIVMVVVGALLLREPDFGAFVVIVVTAMAILFLGGINPRIFVVLMLVLAVSFACIIIFSQYRRQRLFNFIDPWADELGKGYQLVHALIAFGRGGLFGTGLGGSIEKLFYLPEAYSDFLVAVIAEELGFIGVFILIALVTFLTYRALDIGWQSMALGKSFSGMMAQGIGVCLGFQSIVSLGVNMGLLPTKGLTLPLMSYGGSALLSNGIALGILFRVDWENRCLMRGITQ
ncbi:putative lipid II flippase FtsW [Candidatus Ichthyocystis hellenicum]|uniref:putative lipid II flippase FtsW n=1 Tax=Candidatus Ichthyocystis hellenicum TaxID=1561003 RepID=UPI000A6F0951|nr:putative lipid II flippase FtsW [Candidatus Ichthyocystis hellenicum]